MIFKTAPKSEYTNSLWIQKALLALQLPGLTGHGHLLRDCNWADRNPFSEEEFNGSYFL
jgi:hypothetical protein